MAMLEGQPGLTLQKLNEATQAWVELEYHRAVHSELVPDVNTVLFASDQLYFALVRYRAEHQIPKR